MKNTFNCKYNDCGWCYDDQIKESIDGRPFVCTGRNHCSRFRDDGTTTKENRSSRSATAVSGKAVSTLRLVRGVV